MATVFPIATAVAGALQAAHDQGILHRDIEPGIILLSRGEPLVADLGIAIAVGAPSGSRLAEAGFSLGTPCYTSPEQALGEMHEAKGDLPKALEHYPALVDQWKDAAETGARG